MATTATPPDEQTYGAITQENIDSFQRAFEKEPRFRQAMNAVCVTPVSKVAQSRRKTVEVDNTFSHHLTENKITNQSASGRCWMFASLNTFRVEAIRNMNLADDFELSQNYMTFWDKFEKSNYFLESVMKTLDEPNGNRLVDWLMSGPVQDGGQWHMFINLVRKYGVMPKRNMPETESSSSTGQMCNQLTTMLRDYAVRLRKMRADGKETPALEAAKTDFLGEVYRMLCIHLGEPPKTFFWQWRDKDKNFHRPGEITPKEFYERYVGINLDDMVCLIHDPRPQHEYNRLYTVKFLGNVVGGEIIKYINVDISVLKKAAVDQIKSGAPVWFGNDVGKHLERDLGVMDLDIFEYDLVYGTEPKMNKAERLMYGHSLMTHAMVFTGVDLDEDGTARKWRVENSWGDKGGDKGYYSMTDSWFDEYMYEVVVHKQFVPAEVLAVLDQEPVGLDPWDPMGSLAVAE